MFTQMREMEDAKAEKLRKIEDAKAEKIRELEELRLTKFREEEAERRRAEDVARRDRKEDEDRAKEKKERQQEKLRGLGMFREASDLCAYLDRFERIMRDCEINRAEWLERLFARLTERLCMKVSELMDEGADYEILKGALLKAVGETTITYGHKLFELTGEALKAKTGDEVVDTICRICKGLFQGAKSVEECVFALAMAVTRQVTPSSGKVFIENKTITNVRELREAWCDWMSGRQRGNFYKMLGSSSGVGQEEWVMTTLSKSTMNCFICGEAGHRAVDCKANRSIRPNVDRVSGSVSQARKPTCYNCHKDGHKSPDCPLKKVGMTVKKEPLGGGLSPVNVETKGKEEKNNIVWGKVNGKLTNILVDTGADIGLVTKSMVAQGAEDFGEILISGVCGETNLRKCTRAMFEVAV